MADETKLNFRIGEDLYEVPAPDDFTMDDLAVIYDYAGIVWADFAPSEDEEEEEARNRRLGQPAYMQALIHIAYQRAHPEMKYAEIKKLTGAAKIVSLFEETPEDDAGPPDETETRLPSQAESSASPNGSESSDSPASSDDQADQPETIGMSG